MPMKIKNMIGYLFAALAVVFFATCLYNLLIGKPDKISVEWQSHIMFASIGFAIIICLALLAFGILKSKRWVFYFHSVILVLWFAFWIYFLLSSQSQWEGHWFENSLAILVISCFPLGVEFFLFKIKNSFNVPQCLQNEPRILFRTAPTIGLCSIFLQEPCIFT